MTTRVPEVEVNKFLVIFFNGIKTISESLQIKPKRIAIRAGISPGSISKVFNRKRLTKYKNRIPQYKTLLLYNHALGFTRPDLAASGNIKQSMVKRYTIADQDKIDPDHVRNEVENSFRVVAKNIEDLIVKFDFPSNRSFANHINYSYTNFVRQLNRRYGKYPSIGLMIKVSKSFNIRPEALLFDKDKYEKDTKQDYFT